MIKIGKYNRLRVVKNVDFGTYLDGGEAGEILLPGRYVSEPLQPGDDICGSPTSTAPARFSTGGS